MKNMMKFFGIIALVAVTAFAGCKHSSGSDDLHITVNSTEGELKITGLNSYNGKFVIAVCEDHKLLAAAEIKSDGVVSGGQVVNDEVTLKVWRNVSATVWGNFDETGDFEFEADIFSVKQAVRLHGEHYHAIDADKCVAYGDVEADFTNGNGEGDFEYEGDGERSDDHHH